MALQYSLKDSPCSTEWIDMCYKCTSKFVYIVWSHFIDYACHQKRSKKPTQTQVLMLAYLSIWFIKQKKPFSMKRKFFTCNTQPKQTL